MVGSTIFGYIWSFSTNWEINLESLDLMVQTTFLWQTCEISCFTGHIRDTEAEEMKARPDLPWHSSQRGQPASSNQVASADQGWGQSGRVAQDAPGGSRLKVCSGCCWAHYCEYQGADWESVQVVVVFIIVSTRGQIERVFRLLLCSLLLVPERRLRECSGCCCVHYC